jgi:hypothetical protein
MSLFPWSNLSRLFLRFGLLGATAAVSATIVVVVVLLGTLAVSPTARAQAQQLFARFVAVDSPEAFLAEQAGKQQAALAGSQESLTPEQASDTAAAGKGEVAQDSVDSVAPDASTADKVTEPAEAARPPRPTPAPGEDTALQMGGSQGVAPEAGFTLPQAPRDRAPSLAASASLEEAQSKTNFDIRTPTWLPDGYSLQGVMVPPAPASNLPQPADAPQLAAPALATLNFSNGAGEVFVLSQMQRPQLSLPGRAAPEVLLPIPQDKGSVQEITINGQPGQYIQMNSGGGQVHWQDASGVMYDLISNTLDQATLIRIAESVQ